MMDQSGEVLLKNGLAENKLREGVTTDESIREGMSGNICRCGAYPNIVAAVRSVRGRA